ncbi:MAG: hypothetical protein ACFFAO_15570, partial [Candidatus Hermodarchaeota archaeon]
FFLCNYLGPDVGWVLGIGRYTHSLIFWPLFALILADFYYYFTRFTIRIDGIKSIEIVDLEGHKLHYINTYMLVLAAGILHNYLDGIMNKGGSFRIIPQLPLSEKELYVTLKDFMNFGQKGVLQIHFLLSLFIGVTLIFGFVFVFTYFLKKDSKKNAVIVSIYLILFVFFFYLAGYVITTFHPDGGAIIYVTIFWGAPLILCALSTKDFKFIRRDENGLINSQKEPAGKSSWKLFLILTWFFTSALLLMFVSAYFLVFNRKLATYVFSNYGDQLSPYFSYIEFVMLIITIGVITLAISLINFFCGFGLLVKNKVVWKFAVFYNLILSWTIIGLTITCALNENSIKKTFEASE